MKKSPITTQKVIETYLPFGIVSFQCNWNGTRFLSPGTEFTSCVTCCHLRNTENLKIECRHILEPSLLSRTKSWVKVLGNRAIQPLNFALKTCISIFSELVSNYFVNYFLRNKLHFLTQSRLLGIWTYCKFWYQ